MHIDDHGGRYGDHDAESLRDALELARNRADATPSFPASARGNLPPPGASDLGALARRIYEARRARTHLIPEAAELFQEPAWDLMLDLFIARGDRRQVGISSACIAANVPPTTALRWLQTLIERGLVDREDDPHDRRRALVRLSVRGLAVMEAYLRAV